MKTPIVVHAVQSQPSPWDILYNLCNRGVTGHFKDPSGFKCEKCDKVHRKATCEKCLEVLKKRKKAKK